LKAFNEIAKNQRLNKLYIDLISNSLKEEYIPIVLNALDALWNYGNLSNSQIKNLLYIIDNKSSQILEKVRNLFRREINSYKELFKLLDNNQNYEILTKTRFRSLLITSFESIFELEEFKALLIDSNWDETYKEPLLREIDTFEKILLKRKT
jgi:hypothetical protein